MEATNFDQAEPLSERFSASLAQRKIRRRNATESQTNYWPPHTPPPAAITLQKRIAHYIWNLCPQMLGRVERVGV
jgi:hypothetical protein